MPTVTEFPNVSRLNELMIVGPVKVRSACSHHLCPILGRVWIGVLPNEHSNLIGLSKYARICDWIMSRPQIQEEAVTMLADELQERVKPDGLAIVMEADHFCMHWRGVKDDESAMTNSRDARRLPEGPEPAARIPVAAVQEERGLTMLVRLMYASRAAPRRPGRAARDPASNARPTTRSPASPACCASPTASSCRCSRAGAARSTALQPHRGRPAPHRRGAARLRGDRRAALRRLVDGPGEHGAPEPGAAAEVLRVPPRSIRIRSSGEASMALFDELVATARSWARREMAAP